MRAARLAFINSLSSETPCDGPAFCRNLGHELKPFTPTRRGFSTFFGFYAACHVDYWYHGAPSNECGTNAPGDAVTDLSNSTAEQILPAPGLNGTYSEELFTAEAVRLIGRHAAAHNDAKGLYIYLAYRAISRERRARALSRTARARARRPRAYPEAGTPRWQTRCTQR